MSNSAPPRPIEIAHAASPSASLVALLDRELDGLDRSRLVLAYSGGPDSTALACALRSLGIRPLLVHVDHALRLDHEDEAAWVRAAAARWGLELVQERVAPGAIGRSIEAGGRAARYAILARVATARCAAAVLTAHTADDQAETVLLRLARGTGARGLAAIPPRRALVLGSSTVLARPLLEAPRQVLALALGHWNEPAYSDPSNASRTFHRNRVRHERLARWPPRVRDALVRVARASACVADRARTAARAALPALEEVPPLERLGLAPAALAGEGAFVLDRARLRALPMALWSYALEERLGGTAPRLESAHLERFARQLAGRSGQVIEWPGGWRVHVYARWILVARRLVQALPAPMARPIPDGDPVAIALDPLPLVLRLRRGVPADFPPAPGAVRLPATARPLMVRGPARGDSIVRAVGRKAVRALLADGGWAAPLRSAWPVLVAGDEVLWIPGVGAARAEGGGVRTHAWLATPDGETITL